MNAGWLRRAVIHLCLCGHHCLQVKGSTDRADAKPCSVISFAAGSTQKRSSRWSICREMISLQQGVYCLIRGCGLLARLIIIIGSHHRTEGWRQWKSNSDCFLHAARVRSENILILSGNLYLWQHITLLPSTRSPFEVFCTLLCCVISKIILSRLFLPHPPPPFPLATLTYFESS